MGDVDINKFRGLDPLHVQEFTGVEPLHIEKFTGVEPLRIGQIAPAPVHIKELNHIDPITVESLRIDEVRNVEPVRIERFDVTRLPTVNVSMSRFPSLDLDIRRMPPLAVAVQQDFCLPSEYTVNARLLGVEVLRLEIQGRTMINPIDRFRRERSRTHERSFPDVAAAGNPGIPTKRIEGCVTAVTRTSACRAQAPTKRTPTPGPRPPFGFRPPAPRPALSVGSPRFSYPLSRPEDSIGGSVSWGGEG